jgi:glycosyltransferase involved in cell wall biosynthesis
MGSQPQEEVFRLYAIMNICAMPSLYEGFGLTAVEAMAAGLPVVATRVDGLTEIVIDHETGRLVPTYDAKALADALMALLASPEAAADMGRKGQQRVETHFSLQRFSDSTLAAYAVFQESV